MMQPKNLITWELAVCLSLTALGLHCCVRTLSGCGKRASHCSGFSHCRAWTLGHTGFSSCSTKAQQPCACGIFPGQESNSYPLHWQVDSQPLDHQGSPGNLLEMKVFGASQVALVVKKLPANAGEMKALKPHSGSWNQKLWESKNLCFSKP